MSTLSKNISNFFKTLWFKIKLFAKKLFNKLKAYLIELKKEPITKREKLIAVVIIIYVISKIL